MSRTRNSHICSVRFSRSTRKWFRHKDPEICCHINFNVDVSCWMRAQVLSYFLNFIATISFRLAGKLSYWTRVYQAMAFGVQDLIAELKEDRFFFFKVFFCLVGFCFTRKGKKGARDFKWKICTVYCMLMYSSTWILAFFFWDICYMIMVRSSSTLFYMIMALFQEGSTGILSTCFSAQFDNSQTMVKVVSLKKGSAKILGFFQFTFFPEDVSMLDVSFLF